MNRVDEYITEKEVVDFCSKCNELCSRHCVIWRNAENRYTRESLAGALKKAEAQRR